MARRLNWDKAKRRDRQRVEKLRASARNEKARQRQGDSLRQTAIQAFVDKYSIECFGCGKVAARWAKNGVSKKGPWVIWPPTLQAAVPDWRAGHMIALGRGRMLRVSGTRVEEGTDGEPVSVLIVEPD